MCLLMILRGPSSAMSLTGHDTHAVVISAIHEQLLPHVGSDFDHWHLSHTYNQRWNEDGDLIDYGLDVGLAVCTKQRCLVAGDGGIAGWCQLPYTGVMLDAEGRPVRSDEAMAAAAIQGVLPECRVEKIPQGTGPTDLRVTFPDQSTALVEVTMHTDSGKRKLQKAKPRPQRGNLRFDWHIRILDARRKGWYGNDDDLDLRQLQPILLGALQRVESEGGDLGDQDLIRKACEQALAEQWHGPSGVPSDDRPPLAVLAVEHQPPQGSSGSVKVSAGPCTFNFRNVVDISDLKTALQDGIKRKLTKNQWGDTPHRRWLAVVLDDSEAATQLVGDAFKFEDHTPDFSDLARDGLDEVWAIALHDKRLTVLRLRSSGDWEHRADLAVSCGTPLRRSG